MRRRILWMRVCHNDCGCAEVGDSVGRRPWYDISHATEMEERELKQGKTMVQKRTEECCGIGVRGGLFSINVQKDVESVGQPRRSKRSAALYTEGKPREHKLHI